MATRTAIERLKNAQSMDLRAIRIFLTVAEERSFSRAARKVDRTQPAVSYAVDRLEKAVGASLLTEARRRLFLPRLAKS
jgi:DNA-binding transcriptional LysR family regulator